MAVLGTALALATLLPVPRVGAQTKQAVIPFEFRRGHLMIAASVGGTNQVWMMLDTGFSITTIDSEVARRLNLRPGGRTTIAGIAGQEEAVIYEGIVFHLGGASYAPRRVAALPSHHKERERKMEGILGAGFFRRFVVEIDPRAQTLRLHRPADYHYAGPGEVLPIRFQDSTPVIDADILLPGHPPIRGRFEIDTGCDGGLCLGHEFVAANQLLQAGGVTEEGGRTGVGGDARTRVGSVPQLRLGRLVVEKPEANFFLQGSPVEPGHAGHIGIEMLRQFRTILDYSRRQLILESYAAGGAG